MKKTLIAMSGGVDSSLAAKPDSQDICFVPDGDYAGVIECAGTLWTAPATF